MLLIPLLSLLFFSDVQIDDLDPGPAAAAAVISQAIGEVPIFDSGDVSEHSWPAEYEAYAGLFPYALPVPGNHDWYAIEAWPYSHAIDVTVGGIHVVGFDSAYRTDPAALAALLETLDDGPTPTILFTHIPLFSANVRVGAAAALSREALLPIVEAAGVDLVVGGHGHAYERHEYGGRTFLVAGTGGAALDVVGSAATLVVSASRHGWVEVDRAGDDLLVRFLADDGSVVDAFAIQRELPVEALAATWSQVKRLYCGGAR